MDFSRYDNIPYGPFLEEWKDIESCDIRYQISNYGRVRSIKKSGVFFLKKRTHKTGHIRTDIMIGGKSKNVIISRLVSKYFIPNPENKPCVNHIRGFKDDNMFTQLEWMTYYENNLHSIFFLGTKSNVGDWNLKTIEQRNMDGILINTFNNMAEAEKLGFTGSAIWKCLVGRCVHHKKYRWNYQGEEIKKMLKKSPKKKNSSSKYIGVYLHEKRCWIARINVNKKQIYLGIFPSEDEAALAYNKAAIKNKGEFATLNIIIP